VSIRNIFVDAESNMKRAVLLIPFLYTLVSLLQLFYVSAIVVAPNQILRPLVTVWVLLLFLLLPINWLLRDWNWTAIFLTVFVLGFFFSVDYFSVISIIIASIFGVWLVVAKLLKVKVEISHFLNFLAGLGVVFALYSFVIIGTLFSKIPLRDYWNAVAGVKDFQVASLSTPEVKRDIYYIILDDYARSDVLQELYGYDNSFFLEHLDQLGFIVLEDYHSNYPTTHLSVASTLNMEYIQEFAPGLEDSYSRWLMKPFIDYSRVRTLLEEEGYQTISISSNWTITENTTTDMYYHPYPVMLSNFEGFILGSTPLRLVGPILQGFSSVRSADSQREVVTFNFKTLASIPKIPGPKFVFAHIISPHPPFIFDKAGNPVEINYAFNFKDGNEYPGSKDEYRQGYIDQLQFVNRRLLETISAIIENSDFPPIIILQADHGSGLFIDFTSSVDTCIKERFSPFAAYYLPGVNDRSFVSDVSGVNTFRIVFNEYFDARLPLLDNLQYYYKKDVSFYEFEDVTSRVDNGCK